MMHPEDDLQMAVMELLSLMPVFAFHPKNSGAKTIQQATRDKKLGIKPGVADICIMWPGNVGFIELKTAKGKLMESQIAFSHLCNIWNHRYEVCRSIEDVQKVLQKWGIV